MTHTVAVQQFEGPLGLLLELVEKNQLSVTELSVAAITSQYLERIKQLPDQDAEQLSEFLQLGARLLHIKSLALLPREAAAEQADELARLNFELEEYRRFQTAARALAQRGSSSWTRPVVSRLATEDLPLPSVTMPELTEAFQRALRRTTIAPPTQVLNAHLSQAALAARLRRQLRNGSFELDTLLETLTSRLEVIVMFLAVLELMRSGELRLVQRGQFTPIIVEPANV
ncbi:MAG TPA: ScpA family protein [Candidatus Saccharimonas sp.]|nr:ScpA family protein [Candidatus Saccharimonas sp.]